MPPVISRRLAHPTLEGFPVVYAVALLAAHSELTIMGVVAAVAGDAITANGGSNFASRCCLFMTAFTGDIAMRTLQPVFGLGVMVEVPDGPSSGVVTGIAAHSKLL